MRVLEIFLKNGGGMKNSYFIKSVSIFIFLFIHLATYTGGTRDVGVYNYICDSCDSSTCSRSSKKNIRLVADTTKKTVNCSLGFGYGGLAYEGNPNPCQITVGNDEKVTVYLPDLSIKADMIVKSALGWIWKRGEGHILDSPVTGYLFCTDTTECNPCDNSCYESGTVNYYLKSPWKPGDLCQSLASCQDPLCSTKVAPESATFSKCDSSDGDECKVTLMKKGRKVKHHKKAK